MVKNVLRFSGGRNFYEGDQRRVRMTARKGPIFCSENGARFYGCVEAREEGVYVASCYATEKYSAGIRLEEPRYHTCQSRAEGFSWIQHQASRRGFVEWINETP